MKKKASSHKIAFAKATHTDDGIPIRCAFWGLKDVADLCPNPQNPKRHPQRQLELYAKIIREAGWRRPIVVSKQSGFIVKGHGAYEAARDILKSLEVPVDVQEYDSPEAELADLLADNKLAEQAEYDEAALTELLGELTGKIDLELAGILSDLAEDAPATLKKLEVPPAPPAMTWVLIGIPTVRFGEVSALVEKAARLPDVQVETTFGDAPEAAQDEEENTK